MDGKRDWEYERGSHLRAAVTFDIRNAPTIARIHLTDGSRPWVVTSMHIKSPLVIAKPGDPRRVDEQLDLLEAALKGLRLQTS